MILDNDVRKKALNPEQSYIVQAPAGSGKTELLTQRYITLLNTVKNPEEILAITFTKKAAAEMKNRIIRTLENHNETSSHVPKSLIEEVLRKDSQYHWHLLENPARLRIMTLDAFSLSLLRRMPIRSKLGGTPNISENAKYLYQHAIQALLRECQSNTLLNQAFENICLHLDNKFDHIESLLIEMLSKREQWLTYAVQLSREHIPTKTLLEKGLINAIKEHIHQTIQAFPLSHQTSFIDILIYVANNLNKPTQFVQSLAMDLFSESALDALSAWEFAHTVFFTKALEIRKSFTIDNGFPPPSGCTFPTEKKLRENKKIEVQTLAENLQQHPQFLSFFKQIAYLPLPEYQHEQLLLLKDLFMVMVHLSGLLQISFSQHHTIDFPELTIRALNALDDDDSPTDLALTLDYQIHHVLIDEFQDTSISHLKLIEKLVTGWQPGDGKSIFIVGDPMQSIYKFRDADVSLFEYIKQHGLSNIKLQALHLSTNFRSTAPLIKWYNDIFTHAFPSHLDMNVGAIPFYPSQPYETTSISREPIFHHITNSYDQECQHIIQLTKKLLHDYPDEKIAILVQSRTHLHTLVKDFKAYQIPYNAVEIEQLYNHPIIQDVYMLTRAILRLQDKVAWLSILRAPWCGLTLQDIFYISQHQQYHTIFENILAHNRISLLSENAHHRISMILPTLMYCVKNRFRLPLVELVEYAWHELKGAAAFDEALSLDEIQTYFNLLDRITARSNWINIQELDEQLMKYFNTVPKSSKVQVEIMTIHKSKGLEFDNVILAGATRGVKSNQNKLLYWYERTNHNHTIDLMLAPIKKIEQGIDRINNYFQFIENEKNNHERLRLLYVAATRAKKSLHIMLTLQELTPVAFSKIEKTSIVYPIHTILKKQCFHEPILNHSTIAQEPAIPLKLKRYSCTPTFYELSDSVNSFFSVKDSVSFPAEPLEKINLGIVYHQILHHIIKYQLPLNSKERVLSYLLHYGNSLLLKLGTSSTALKELIPILTEAIRNTLNDPKAQWFLDLHHSSSQSELPLASFDQTHLSLSIIDRTFIDNGVRWIIDYKVTDPKEDLQELRKRYQSQLETYANLIHQIDPRHIKLGLYFPLTSTWIEWDHQKTN